MYTEAKWAQNKKKSDSLATAWAYLPPSITTPQSSG